MSIQIQSKINSKINNRVDNTIMTIDFIVLMCLIITTFEVYAYNTEGALTISEQMRMWNDKWPIFPWMFVYGCGILTGHFFWTSR
jgi:uncharacterized membrane protein